MPHAAHAPLPAHLAGLPNEARLLAVAAEEIRRHGARRVTVVAVAEAAGMSHANVYRYFTSKTALVDAVSAAWLKSVEAALADVAGAPDPADDKLERMLVALARALRERLEDAPASSTPSPRRWRPTARWPASTGPAYAPCWNVCSTKASAAVPSGWRIANWR